MSYLLPIDIESAKDAVSYNKHRVVFIDEEVVCTVKSLRGIQVGYIRQDDNTPLVRSAEGIQFYIEDDTDGQLSLGLHRANGERTLLTTENVADLLNDRDLDLTNLECLVISKCTAHCVINKQLEIENGVVVFVPNETQDWMPNPIRDVGISVSPYVYAVIFNTLLESENDRNATVDAATDKLRQRYRVGMRVITDDIYTIVAILSVHGTNEQEGGYMDKFILVNRHGTLISMEGVTFYARITA